MLTDLAKIALLYSYICTEFCSTYYFIMCLSLFCHKICFANALARK